MNRILGTGLALILALGGTAQAAPVVITAYAVTDGQLGALAFSAAPVTLTFSGDTRDVIMTTSGGVVSYRIEKGYATVAVNVQGKTTVAKIDDGQVYVHYDLQTGIAGFGSANGPDYPLTLGCYNVFNLCNYQNPTVAGSYEFYNGFNQIVPALADIDLNSGDTSYYSSALKQLPQSLTRSTLLTGYVNACAWPYVLSNGLWCSGPPTQVIATSIGDFYLQDQNYPTAKGILTVEVSTETED